MYKFMADSGSICVVFKPQTATWQCCICFLNPHMVMCSLSYDTFPKIT